jgi:hypothetical protein
MWWRSTKSCADSTNTPALAGLPSRHGMAEGHATDVGLSETPCSVTSQAYSASSSSPSAPRDIAGCSPSSRTSAPRRSEPHEDEHAPPPRRPSGPGRCSLTKGAAVAGSLSIGWAPARRTITSSGRRRVKQAEAPSLLDKRASSPASSSRLARDLKRKRYAVRRNQRACIGNPSAGVGSPTSCTSEPVAVALRDQREPALCRESSAAAVASRY